MKKRGILSSMRTLHGWGGDLEIVVDGEKFYKRLGTDKTIDGVPAGKLVEVEYSPAKTKFFDWVFDKILYASFGIPMKYNELESLREVHS